MIDRLVLAAVNRGLFPPADFAPVEGKQGLYLTAPALRHFLQHYEDWMKKEAPKETPWRKALRIQAESFVRALRDSTPWQPFTWKSAPLSCATSSVTT